MRYFKQTDFDDRSGRIWFHADKYDVNHADLECTFEEATFTGVATNASGITAALSCVFAPPTALMAGTTTAPHNDIVASFEPTTLSMAGTYVDPAAPLTGDISCTFVEPHLEMTSGRGMVCTFEPLELIINEVINMADMNLTFKEMDMLAVGNHTFCYMDLECEKPEAQMYSGLILDLEMEDMQLKMSGSVGINANMVLRARRMEISLTGGALPYMACGFEPMGMVASGNTPVIADLKCLFSRPTLSMLGQQSVVASLTGRFRQLSMLATGTNHPVASLTCRFVPLRFEASSLASIQAMLEATFLRLRLEASDVVVGDNDLVGAFEEPELAMWSGIGSGVTPGLTTEECDLADTLVYGG